MLSESDEKDLDKMVNEIIMSYVKTNSQLRDLSNKISALVTKVDIWRHQVEPPKKRCFFDSFCR